MTRHTDETLPEELREAIELERSWDRLPPQVEERLARRIEHSLVSMDPSIPIERGGPPPGAEAAPPPVVPPGSAEAVSAVATATSKSSVIVGLAATASSKWGVVLAGTLILGGVGAGTVAALRSLAPSMDPPRREAPAPVVAPTPEPPPPPPPSPLEVGEPPAPVPAVAPPPASSPPPRTKPSAASRPEVKRKPPAPPPSEAPALERDWALLEAARASNAVGRYGDALSAVTEHAQEHPASQFEQERQALRIHALVGLGRQDEARALAKSFEQRFPESILLEGIRQVIGGE